MGGDFPTTPRHGPDPRHPPSEPDPRAASASARRSWSAIHHGCG
jgi:hypothetical protein